MVLRLACLDNQFNICKLSKTSLCAHIDHRPFNLAKLLRLVGSTQHCFAFAADLRTVCCSTPADCSALPQASPPPSVGSPPRSQEIVSAALMNLHHLAIISPPSRLISCEVGSIHAILVSCHLHASPNQYSSMAPPSINTTMGHSSGCGLDKQPSSPIISIFITILDFVVCPLPGCSPTSRTNSCLSVPSIR